MPQQIPLKLKITVRGPVIHSIKHAYRGRDIQPTPQIQRIIRPNNSTAVTTQSALLYSLLEMFHKKFPPKKRLYRGVYKSFLAHFSQARKMEGMAVYTSFHINFERGFRIKRKKINKQNTSDIGTSLQFLPHTAVTVIHQSGGKIKIA